MLRILIRAMTETWTPGGTFGVRRAIKSEANCLANDGAISRGRVTSRTAPACGRGYILGYPYSYAVSVSQLAVRSLGADDCASQTRHREQFGTYDEGASAPVRPTVLKCARLRFPTVSGWYCHELRVSPGDRGSLETINIA